MKLGTQTWQRDTAPVRCSCGWWAYNDPARKGAKHQIKHTKQADGHTVVVR